MGKSRAKRRGADVASAAKGSKKQAVKAKSKPRKRLRTIAHGGGDLGGSGGSLTGG
jgi:hypothetical protein